MYSCFPMMRKTLITEIVSMSPQTTFKFKINPLKVSYSQNYIEKYFN